MLCFFKLSKISTDYTYFARYQDAWDVMATVRNVEIEDFKLLSDIQTKVSKQGALSCVIYQKAFATAQIPASAMSDELNRLGGLEAVGQIEAIKDEGVTEIDAASKVGKGKELEGNAGSEEKSYLVQMPIVILDDAGFQEYCSQIGMTPRLDGAVALNRIWDSINSNFRYREYIPYVKESGSTALQCGGQGAQGIEVNDEAEGNVGNNIVEIPIIGYTDQVPVLREEYDNYAFVHVMPLSLWKEVSEKTGQDINVEKDVYVRILMDRANNIDKSMEKSNSMAMQEDELILQFNQTEESLTQLIGQEYEIETENRIQEKATNDRLLWGYQVVLGIFCALLAVIGLANVFSYTMGFLRQRRRECARYLSIGMTPDNLRKMFRIEILIIAGRPVLITLPLTALAVSLMIKASYLNPAEFWLHAPYVPIAVFLVAIFGFVAIAYGIGGRRILRDSLVEALRNEAVM